MVLAACSDELLNTEADLLSKDKVVLAANSSVLITKAGLQFTEFDEGTKYHIYSHISGDSYDWSSSDVVLDKAEGVETSGHLIDLEETIYFKGRTLDIFGATICSDERFPSTSDSYADPTAILGPLSAEYPAFDDLMIAKPLKGKTSNDGLLQLNFIHALSKVQFEVVKAPQLQSVVIKSITIQDTHEYGEIDIVNGTWNLKDADLIHRNFHPEIFGNNGLVVTDKPQDITPEGLSNEGTPAEMLIIPNESGNTPVKIHLTISIDGEDVEKTYPLHAVTEDGTETSAPFRFAQNHRYKLTIMVLSDGIRIVAINPQVYEWIEHTPDMFMGQPVTFGGLMWMDRNLGASSADCENDWANTRGFYYQYGRNIPYIFDQEKFRDRVKGQSIDRWISAGNFVSVSDDGWKTIGNISPSNNNHSLDIGYEYFYTYNEKGERIYGSVQGGVRTGFYRYFVAGKWEWVKPESWESFQEGWMWNGTRYFHTKHSNATDTSPDGKQIAYHYGSSSYMYRPISTSAFSFYSAEPMVYRRLTNRYQFMYGNGPIWGTTYDEQYTSGSGQTFDYQHMSTPNHNVTSSYIAREPGEADKIYHFISDARYYHDYFQSGAWCVLDDIHPSTGENCSDADYKREFAAAGNSKEAYKTWLADGCPFTTKEDADKVNYFWADEDGDPRPENHPCPKGWRIPTKSDFASILPAPSDAIVKSWGTDNKLYCMMSSKCKTADYDEAIIYGFDDNLDRDDNTTGEDDKALVMYIIKRVGDKDCYRLRLIWRNSGTLRKDYYNLSEDRYTTAGHSPYMQYVEISRYPGKDNMDFNYVTGNNAAMTDSQITEFYNDERYQDWNNPTETMNIPLTGFIYTGSGHDCLYQDGIMTILRCVNWNNNYGLLRTEAADGSWNNEAQNWCAYLRTDNASCGVFDGSRKSLGCPIRCVRDVNATK